MYRGRKWTIREICGHSSPHETNKLIQYLLSAGETGINVICDCANGIRIDSDHPFAAGEVGVLGAPLCPMKDVEIMMDGISLDQISMTFTFAIPAWTGYVALAEDKGYDIAMKLINADKAIAIWIATTIAIVFGLLTIKSGGQVLFGGSFYQKDAGNYVLLVVWFNFLAGFIYLVAGVGIWMLLRWAVWLSLLIAIATIIVFSILGMHILNGGGYETRTVAAMSLRSMVWISIFIFSYRKLIRR